MAISEELHHFVRESLKQGQPRSAIEHALRAAGWPPDQIRSALGKFADVKFPIPVPTPVPYVSAREAFLYLLLFTTLYLSAFNLGGLLFQLIELGFPEPGASAAPVHQAMRWSIAILVVAFPVFLFLARLTAREVKSDPTKRASTVRRWLTYVTLFVAASALLGDGAALVYHLLGGELTVRFVLKVATIVVIASAVFWYYLRDLDTDPT
ncbi:MAG TPA: DUF5671 domain-containing protein [Gemmatimonadales bacterium]|nr:DUF5671 domain-containing protein [Gemmatimonadales bacterium]